MQQFAVKHRCACAPRCAQRTYSTTAINFDFALITLASPVSPSLGYFGIERGTGTETLNIASAGYPADKRQGTLWSTTCQNVEYAYGQNQGVFKDVSQCANQVGADSCYSCHCACVLIWHTAPGVWMLHQRSGCFMADYAKMGYVRCCA